MAIRPIIEAPDTYLRTLSTPVETVDDGIRSLVADMFETMYDAPGIGLAAIQVGVAKRLLVIDLQPDPEEEGGERIREPRVFINPEITWESEDFASYNEGCLSVPGLRGLGPQPSATEYAFTTVKAMPIQVDGEVMDLEANTRVRIDIAPKALRTVL